MRSHDTGWQWCRYADKCNSRQTQPFIIILKDYMSQLEADHLQVFQYGNLKNNVKHINNYCEIYLHFLLCFWDFYIETPEDDQFLIETCNLKKKCCVRQELYFVMWLCGGTRWPSWLRHWATSRKIAGSIPDHDFFIDKILTNTLWNWESTQSLIEIS